MANPLTHDELIERLERRVLGPEGQGHRAFLLTEVALGARRADAIGIGLWASRGQLIEGFECKASRRDWLSEYEDHGKAEPALAICDRFWLVTNEEVLQPGELPERWGLLIANGRSGHLKVEKEAPELRDRDVPPGIGREPLVGLLRSLGRIHEADREAIREEGYEEGRHSVDHDHDALLLRAENAEGILRRKKEGHDKLLERAGLDFANWSEGNEKAMELLGAVANAIREGERGLERLHRDIKRHESAAADLTGQLNDILGELSAHIYGKGQAA